MLDFATVSAGIVLWLAATFLFGVLLLTASVPKVAAPARFAETVRRYGLLPTKLVNRFAAAVALLELLLGVGFVFAVAIDWLGFIAAGVLIAFAGAIAINLVRGRRDIECGCFGFGVDPKDRLTWWMVLRDLVLAASAAGLAMVEPVIGIESASIAMRLIAVVLASAAIAFALLLATTAQLRALRRGRPLQAGFRATPPFDREQGGRLTTNGVLEGGHR